MATQEIGLIGLGLLGSALAERLSQHGFVIRGFDLNPERRDALAAAGAVTVESAADVVGHCGTTFLALPTSDVVADVISDAESGLGEGKLVIDTTTGAPDQVVLNAGKLQQLGVRYVEAAVAGSSEQLRQGVATLFVAGDPELVPNLEPLLASITSKRFYLGEIGSAARFKLVHNLLLGLQRAALGESLAFAESMKFDPLESLRILQETPTASPVMETKGWRMARRDYEAQARLAQHLKDVRLVIAQARQSGARVPLSLAHLELLQQAVDLGFGDADNSAIIEAYRRKPDSE